jgi:cbb3-type cytochrome oxidase subunit 3
MTEMLQWLGHLENSKIVALLIFFVAFCGILFYVYTGKQRKERLESYKYIPFADEDNTESDETRKVDKR